MAGLERAAQEIGHNNVIEESNPNEISCLRHRAGKSKILRTRFCAAGWMIVC